MGVNLFVRKSFNAVDLRKAVNEHLSPKMTSIRKDVVMANYIATVWSLYVQKYVPRSEEDGHHLQDAQVSDGRVIWRRPARQDDKEMHITAGQELAGILYEGPIRGQFRSRYSGHNPKPHWDDAVRPGTAEWDNFVAEITPMIVGWVKSNG